MKFKIGERVRLTEDASRMFPRRAKKPGTVVNRTRSGLALIKWDDISTHQKFADSLLSRLSGQQQ